MVPQLERELGICGAEATDKMIFECLNCAFGGIDTMIIRVDELDFSMVFVHEVFYRGHGLIVGDVEDWGVSFLGEQLMYLCKCCYNVFIGGRFDGNGKDIISIIVIGNEK